METPNTEVYGIFINGMPFLNDDNIADIYNPEYITKIKGYRDIVEIYNNYKQSFTLDLFYSGSLEESLKSYLSVLIETEQKHVKEDVETLGLKGVALTQATGLLNILSAILKRIFNKNILVFNTDDLNKKDEDMMDVDEPNSIFISFLSNGTNGTTIHEEVIMRDFMNYLYNGFTVNSYDCGIRKYMIPNSSLEILKKRELSVIISEVTNGLKAYEKIRMITIPNVKVNKKKIKEEEKSTRNNSTVKSTGKKSIVKSTRNKSTGNKLPRYVSLKKKYDEEYYKWLDSLTLSQQKRLWKEKLRMDAYWKERDKIDEAAEIRKKRRLPSTVPPYMPRFIHKSTWVEPLQGGNKKKSKKVKKSKKSKNSKNSNKAKKSNKSKKSKK
jgi:hypothetical protein